MEPGSSFTGPRAAAAVPGGGAGPRSLRLSAWHDGGRAVVALAGDLDLHTAAELREALGELLSSGHAHILVDLGDLSFIDSAGLGVLIGGLRRARAEGGDLALTEPRPAIRRVLAVGGLDGVFRLEAPPPRPGDR